MKKIIILVLFVLTLVACSNDEQVTKKKVEELCGLDVEGCTVLQEVYETGGIHGDGENFMKLDCGEIEEDVERQVQEWNELPLNQYLANAIYGEQLMENLSEKYNIPNVENGRYYFYDKHKDAIDPFDVEAAFGEERMSKNFILAIYDANNNILYILEYDS